jgi:23S rRNA pseudouridine2605 synthase
MERKRNFGKRDNDSKSKNFAGSKRDINTSNNEKQDRFETAGKPKYKKSIGSEKDLGNKKYKKKDSFDRKFDDKRSSAGSSKPFEKHKYNENKFEDKNKRANSDGKNFRNNSKKEDKSINASSTGEIRLNKYLSNAGVCSRREADILIATGVVEINGKIVTELGTKVKPGDIVKYDGQQLKAEKKVYVLMNKPKDFVTTLDDPEGRKTVIDLIKDEIPQRIYPVGRLDRNTTGLLLLTNDGDLAKKLTHPKYNKKKIYHVVLDRPVSPELILEIAQGIELEDGFIKVDKIAYVENNKSEIGVELHSGRNRIVRRIFEKYNYNIKRLDRVFFAGLTKLNLPRGKWRFLTEREIVTLKTGMHE